VQSCSFAEEIPYSLGMTAGTDTLTNHDPQPLADPASNTCTCRCTHRGKVTTKAVPFDVRAAAIGPQIDMTALIASTQAPVMLQGKYGGSSP
jgi:hypothetical protein